MASSETTPKEKFNESTDDQEDMSGNGENADPIWTLTVHHNVDMWFVFR